MFWEKNGFPSFQAGQEVSGYSRRTFPHVEAMADHQVATVLDLFPTETTAFFQHR